MPLLIAQTIALRATVIAGKRYAERLSGDLARHVGWPDHAGQRIRPALARCRDGKMIDANSSAPACVNDK